MATIVFDNGAYTSKIGSTDDFSAKVAPNCIIKAKTVRNRVFVADQIDECKDLSGLYFLLAFQKGYLTNWEVERQVWDHLLGKGGIGANLEESGIIITEPQFNFRSIQEAMDEILFEEFQVPFLLRCPASFLSQHKVKRTQNADLLCCLVVDSGYSFTHIVPYHKGKPIKQAIKRVSVGGKLLTNHLKETISYRQLMVMDETHVVNQLKEDTCFVSQNFYEDMKKAKQKHPQNNIVCDYVLPDYTHSKRGYLRSPNQQLDSSQQIIRMGNERFSIPELLFHPSDIGIHEMGLAEAIDHVISLVDEDLRPFFYLNIILTGGNFHFPGIKERLEKEVRSLTPDHFDISIRIADNPSLDAWEGGKLLGTSSDFLNLLVTKDQYEEYGHNICSSTFLY